MVNRAFVTVYCIHDLVDDRIDELSRFFGVTVPKEFHRSLEVGKKDRDLLAFAFQRAPGCQDLFGEVLGGIGLG